MNKTLLATLIATATLGLTSNIAYAQDTGATTISVSPTDTGNDDMDHSNMVMPNDDISQEDLLVNPSNDDGAVIVTGVDGDSPDAIDIAPDDSGAVDIVDDSEVFDGDNINESSSSVNYN